MDSENGRPPKAVIHRRTEIYRGRHFGFVTEDLTLPNGRRTEMAMVRHPGSIGVVPLFDDGSVLMEHQYRHCVRDYLLEMIADGEITDALTILALQRAWFHRHGVSGFRPPT